MVTAVHLDRGGARRRTKAPEDRGVRWPRERLRHPTCLKIRPRGGEGRATTSSELQPPRSSAVRLPRFDRSGSALSFRHPPPRSRVCKAGSDSSSGSAVKAPHELRSSICSEVRPERAGSAAIEVQPLMSSQLMGNLFEGLFVFGWAAYAIETARNRGYGRPLEGASRSRGPPKRKTTNKRKKIIIK